MRDEDPVGQIPKYPRRIFLPHSHHLGESPRPHGDARMKIVILTWLGWSHFGLLAPFGLMLSYPPISTQLIVVKSGLKVLSSYLKIKYIHYWVID